MEVDNDTKELMFESFRTQIKAIEVKNDALYQEIEINDSKIEKLNKMLSSESPIPLSELLEAPETSKEEKRKRVSWTPFILNKLSELSVPVIDSDLYDLIIKENHFEGYEDKEVRHRLQGTIYQLTRDNLKKKKIEAREGLLDRLILLKSWIDGDILKETYFNNHRYGEDMALMSYDLEEYGIDPVRYRKSDGRTMRIKSGNEDKKDSKVNIDTIPSHIENGKKVIETKTKAERDMNK